MLLRNAWLNLIGLGVPIVLALIFIPVLIGSMGTTRFGLLTLVWVILGYFSLFDLGIGRALTKLVAERIARGDKSSLPGLIRTALFLSLVLGVVVGGVLILSSSYAVAALFPQRTGLDEEARWSLVLVGVALPLVTGTAALRGVLEAYQRFDVTSRIRIAMGVLSYGGPVLVTLFTSNLAAVVAFLVCGRALTWLWHFLHCYRLTDGLLGRQHVGATWVKPLFALGGWMTVSNVVSPMMTYLDRFLVAKIAGPEVVAFYTTPYEAIMKLTVVPDALLGVLFPALAAALASANANARTLYETTSRVLTAVLLPITCIVVVLSREALSLWIDDVFAERSVRVLQVLAIGVLVNALARVPFTVIHSSGRPDLTAKLHLIELPIYLGVATMLIIKFGILGAAIAWGLRAAADLLLLERLRRSFLPGPSAIPLPWVALTSVGIALVLVMQEIYPNRQTTFGLGLALFLSTVAICWFKILRFEDRAHLIVMIRRKLRNRVPSSKERRGGSS
jgi:O-antigen/teichoic acid export membrane protein